jgi:cell division protein FtsI (penicillin-binding protein 3)
VARPPAARASSVRRRAPAPPTRPPVERLVALLAIVALAFTGILARLIVIQVGDASALSSMAVDQRARDLTITAARGTIFDRSGRELAMSLPARDVYADPQLVTDPVDEAQRIARALHLKRAAVRGLLEDRTDGTGRPLHFVYLERGVDLATADALAAQHLPGIGFLDGTRRYYPAGSLAPQVLGFVGVDGTGIDGLEYRYQNLLAGTPGHEVVQEDPSGTLIPQAGATSTPPVPGDDLMLTIDRDIQYRAQQSLAAAVRRNGATGGSVIVMNPHTGEILAMATYPWFDPNQFAEASPDVIRNRPVTDVYEPGSVNKVITAAAALQEHAVGINERFSVPDQMRLYDATFHDAETHPTEQMTLADILAYSSNIGAIKVAEQIGKNRFAKYLRAFGFGRPTGVGFPGEASGILLPVDKWSGTTLPTVSFGQGIAVTPLQMAAVYSTIANGGVWVQPRLVRGTIGPSGKFQPAPPPDTRRVVSEQTAHTIVDMLSYAVDVGTGQEAQIPGYWVAGKTGTARIPSPTGGYLKKYVASFIGLTPASNPQLVVAAVIDQPSTIFGGVAAAPLFQDVARFALARLRVAPAAKPPIPPHAVRTG